jgi:molecular chaperone GrpE
LVRRGLHAIVLTVSVPDKGKFTADISEAVIEEALRSLEKPRSGGAAEQTEPEPGSALAISPEESERELNELRSQIALSQEENRDAKARLEATSEQLVRMTADFENHRRRTKREAEEVRQLGAETLLVDFLPVIDNLDRALDHASTGGDLEGLMQGIAMTRKLFEDVLSKHGVRPVMAVGHPFDPHYHEAIQQVETAEVAPNQVISELVPGYTLHYRLLRPALVTVSKRPTAETPTSPNFGSEASSQPAEDSRESGEREEE